MDSSLKKEMAELQTVRVVVFCFLIIMMEGFDIQAAGVAAPRIAPAFKLAPAQMGMFFSSSAVGVLIFAMLGGILADRFGRKWVMIAATAAFGVACGLTPLCPNFESLVVVRFLTGAGLGAAMPAVIAMTSDHSPASQKKRYVGIVYCAITFGGTIAAAVVWNALLGEDWRNVFYIGGIVPILIALAMIAWLPESKARLLPGGQAADQGSWSDIVGLQKLPLTIVLWVATFCTLAVMYLSVMWLPSLLAASGLSRGDTMICQMFFNGIASVSALSVGFLLDRKMVYSVPTVGYVILAAALAGLALLKMDLFWGILVGAGLGVGTTIGQTLLYAFAPLCYPAGVRNRGVGCAVTAGRAGTIFGPMFAGMILSFGLTPAQLALWLLPICLIALLTVLPVSYYIAGHQGQAPAPVGKPQTA